jgi:hypothetical protein
MQRLDRRVEVLKQIDMRIGASQAGRTGGRLTSSRRFSHGGSTKALCIMEKE